MVVLKNGFQGVSAVFLVVYLAAVFFGNVSLPIVSTVKE